MLFPEAVENFLDLVETCAACAPGLGVLGDLFGGAEVVFFCDAADLGIGHAETLADDASLMIFGILFDFLIGFSVSGFGELPCP